MYLDRRIIDFFKEFLTTGKKSHLSQRKMIFISVVTGMLCFLFSDLGLNYDYNGRSVIVPWSIIFPILSAMAFGWKYGLISALAGAAFYPFYLWPEDGFANLLTTITYTLYYVAVGLLTNVTEEIKKRRAGVVYRGILLLNIFYSITIYFSFTTLFNPLLALNPLLEGNNYYIEIEKSILANFAYKDIISIISMTLLADLLLTLPLLRRVFGLRVEDFMRRNAYIMGLTFLVSSLLILLFITIDSVFQNQKDFSPEQILNLLVTGLIGSILVARSIISLIENEFSINESFKALGNSYSSLFNTVSEAIFILNYDSIILDSNSGVEKIFGYKRWETIGKNFRQFLSLEKDVSYYLEDFGNKGAYEKQRKISSTARNKDGDIIYIDGIVDKSQYLGKKALILTFRDNTLQKKQENQLKESLAIARTTLEFAEDGYLVVDLSGSIKVVNTRLEEIFNLKSDASLSITETNILENLSKASLNPEEFISNMNELLSTHGESNKRIVELNTERVIEVSVKAYYDDQIELCGRIWSFRDITDIIRREEKTRLSEIFFRESQMAGNIGSFEIKFKDDYWTSSELLNEIFGIDDGYIKSYKGWLNTIHPDDRDLVDQYIREEIISRGERFSKIYRICRIVDGQERWVSVQGTPVPDNIGTIDRLIGTVQDITSAKTIELKLQENENKLNALFEAMSEMVVVYNLILNDAGEVIDYRIVDYNKAHEKMSGIRREDAIGKLATDLSKEKHPPYLKLFSSVNMTGVAEEYTTYDKPMDKNFLISVISPKKNQIATITTDISSMVRIQKVIASKNWEMENYLYVASHDLRSPLLNVHGFSRRLAKYFSLIENYLESRKNEDKLPETLNEILKNDAPKALEFITASITKMDSLISGLLQISRTGRVRLNIKHIEMENLINKVLKDFVYQLNEIDAKVDLSAIPDCYGDESLLNQLFSNIISNAIKYRDPSRKLHITIKGQVIFNKSIYRISDNGRGISQKHLERIWDIFFRIDPSSNEPGEGIGLNLVKRIVEKHMGRVWVESEINEGSAFFIELQNNIFTEYLL